MAAHCGRADIAAVVERLDQQVQELNRSRSEPFHLSLSVGSAVFTPGSALGLSELIESADSSMYENKRAKKSAEGPRAGSSADAV